MNSMTGYGSYELHDDDKVITVEVRTLNARYLEISFFLPPGLRSLENNIRTQVKHFFSRGKIEIFVKWKMYNFPVDMHMNKHIFNELNTIHQSYSQYLEKISFSLLLEVGALSIDFRTEDKMHAFVLQAVEIALKNCQQRRMEEGEALFRELNSLNKKLQELLSQLRENIPDVMDDLKDKLLKRYQDISEQLSHIDFDTNKMYTEIANYIIKLSVQEELLRLHEHAHHFSSSLKEKDGKYLDFLCQEMNREVNTMLAKIPSASLQLHIISMKQLIEDMREQVRNVE